MMEMDEVNPLALSPTASANVSECSNKKGRPKLSKAIRFSEEPKSIVSILLSKIRKSQLAQNSAASDFQRPKIEKAMCQESQRKKSKSTRNKHKSSKKYVEQKFFCDFSNCSYSCKLSCNLIKHKRTHTAEKPYLCDQCTFRSNFVNSLKVHKRTHTCERPYACESCPYKCNSSSNLKKHCLHRHPEILKT